jgi:hypothetical protein
MALAGAEAERILCGPLASAGNLEIVHDLALAFHASVSMIKRWAATHAEFRAALKVGKEAADQRVEHSLYQRAVGYSYDAVKIFMPAGAKKPVED